MAGRSLRWVRSPVAPKMVMMTGSDLGWSGFFCAGTSGAAWVMGVLLRALLLEIVARRRW